jgi:hypothetical protein
MDSRCTQSVARDKYEGRIKNYETSDVRPRPPSLIFFSLAIIAPPIKLTRADYYMDGGSLGGTLTDARGQHLDFFFDRGLSENPLGSLLIGFRSGHPDASMKPTFQGWSREDLFLIIEKTIRAQFVWDTASKTLCPKNPHDPTSQAFAERILFARLSVKRILRYVEQGLQRKTSYIP